MKKLATLSVLFVSAASAWAGCSQGMGGSFHPAPGMKVPLFLSLGLGYYLLRMAETESNKLLKIVGRIVSWAILVGSLVGLLCSFCGHCRKPAGGAMSCDMKKPAVAAAACPYSGSHSAGEAAPVEKQ